MRVIEISGEAEMPQEPVATPQVAATPLYADKAQLKGISNELSRMLPAGTFTVNGAGGVKKIPHIRAQKISPIELRTSMTQLGATANSPDATQSVLSGKFPVNSYVKDGVIISVVIGSVKGMGDESSIGIGRKELAPTGLGLDGQTYNRKQLITASKNAVVARLRDEQLKQALVGLVDIAAAGGKGTLDPALAAYIGPVIGVIAQDFGEILAPILIMKGSDQAELPKGNEPLVDVKLKGQNLSVKALTGSGTSFSTIHKLMDQYEAAIGNDDDKKLKFNILKQFHPSSGGKNVDKIIRAASAANLPEYTTLCGILGVPAIKDYADLVGIVKPFALNKQLSYGDFLKTVYPAMVAGNWGKPVGLPADGAYYMGLEASKAPKKEKAAGRNSYESKPGNGGADILTYVMGVGLLNYIRKGSDAATYSQMMTDIVKQADAVLGHITINPDGSMQLYTKPFSQLKFEFQYHAPSHIPGNNLPGFMYVPD